MAYAAVEDVQRLAPQVQLTSTSKPTWDDTNAIIDLVSAIVDSTLKNVGYALPVTGTVSLKIVKEIVTHGVLAHVLRARQYGVGDLNAPGMVYAQERFDKLLAALADPKNPFELPDCPRTEKELEKTGGDMDGNFVEMLEAEGYFGDEGVDQYEPPVRIDQEW
jgi:hypothetical protein